MHVKLAPKNQFLKDYSLPLKATLVFVLTILVMAFIRTQENRSLHNVLSNSLGNDNYAALVRTDAVESFNKSDIALQDDDTAPGNNGDSSVFTVSPTAPSPGGGSLPPDGNGNANPPPPPPPPAPFEAMIDSLVLESGKVECTEGVISRVNCVKRYKFRGVVRAMNGPGLVSYSWLSSVPAAEKDGSFSVGSGESYTPLFNEFSLPCSEPQDFNIQLRLHQPNSDNSDKLKFSHFCENPITPS